MLVVPYEYDTQIQIRFCIHNSTRVMARIKFALGLKVGSNLGLYLGSGFRLRCCSKLMMSLSDEKS